VAIALVEHGTLKNGDFVVTGTTYAKVRNLETTTGQIIATAGPSTPVLMTGFKSLPEFGDEFGVVGNEKTARAAADKAAETQKGSGNKLNLSSSELIRLINKGNKLTELNVIVKADVQGSLASAIDSLKALGTDEVAVRVVSSGVGSITENDEHLAHTSGAIIYAFHVAIPAGIKQLASRDRVKIRSFDVIYELIDDAKATMSDLLKPELKETELGRLIVRGIFKVTKTEVICGGEVTKGKLSLPAFARVLRDGKPLAEVEIVTLKKGPQDIKEVPEGEMCGLSFHSKARVDLQEGDHIELFRRELVERNL
jgi:translation initiation factor IF-2